MIDKILVQTIKEASNLEVTLEISSVKNDCIVYSLQKESDDGCVCRWRLTIKVICKKMINGIEKKKLVDKAIITKGDEKKITEINTLVQNGGGVIYDEDLRMHQIISYYDIITKSEVNF